MLRFLSFVIASKLLHFGIYLPVFHCINAAWAVLASSCSVYVCMRVVMSAGGGATQLAAFYLSSEKRFSKRNHH